MVSNTVSPLGRVSSRLLDPPIARRRLGYLVRYCAALGLSAALAACAGTGDSDKDFAVREIPPDKLCTREVYEEPPEWIYLADHILPVDGLGRYVEVPVGKHGSTARDFKTQVENILKSHARFRQRPDVADQPNRLFFYINGSRNSIETSVERAREQVPCMAKTGYFAVFLAWDSGFQETYWEQVSHVREGRRYDGPHWSTPLYLAADVLKGTVRSPAVLAAQIPRFLGAASKSLGDSAGIEKFDPAREASLLNVRYDGPGQGGEVLALNTLQFLGAWPGKLVATPFADGFGERIWESTLRRTKALVVTPGKSHGSHHRGDELGGGYPMRSSFSNFFEELQLCIDGDPDCRDLNAGRFLADVEITIVGHSVGAIILDDLVHIHGRLPYRNVVQMGSAESFSHFLETVVPVMEAKPELRFYNLSLHPVAEASEANAWGTIPVGSLLEWKDHVYTNNDPLLDKSLGRWVNVAAAAPGRPSSGPWPAN